MMSRDGQRRSILGGLLIATLAAALLVEDEPASTANPPKVPVARTAGAPEPANFREPTPPMVPPDKLAIDPFRAKSWHVPPPPETRPKAPPLPFQYLGKVMEDGETRVFLVRQGRHLIARIGDSVEGDYRVEGIDGGRLIFLYQPLKERQFLDIGNDQ